MFDRKPGWLAHSLAFSLVALSTGIAVANNNSTIRLAPDELAVVVTLTVTQPTHNDLPPEVMDLVEPYMPGAETFRKAQVSLASSRPVLESALKQLNKESPPDMLCRDRPIDLLQRRIRVYSDAGTNVIHIRLGGARAEAEQCVQIVEAVVRAYRVKSGESIDDIIASMALLIDGRNRGKFPPRLHQQIDERILDQQAKLKQIASISFENIRIVP